jgi:hypothetical protein
MADLPAFVTRKAPTASHARRAPYQSGSRGTFFRCRPHREHDRGARRCAPPLRFVKLFALIALRSGKSAQTEVMKHRQFRAASGSGARAKRSSGPTTAAHPSPRRPYFTERAALPRLVDFEQSRIALIASARCLLLRASARASCRSRINARTALSRFAGGVAPSVAAPCFGAAFSTVHITIGSVTG